MLRARNEDELASTQRSRKLSAPLPSDEAATLQVRLRRDVAAFGFDGEMVFLSSFSTKQIET
jgi:hypothetical protein